MKRFLPFLLILVFSSCNLHRANPTATIVKKVKDCCTGLTIHQQEINPEKGISPLSTNLNAIMTNSVMERSVQSLTW